MDDDRTSRLDHIAEEFVAELRAGNRPLVSHFCCRFPELADDIRDLFPTLVTLEMVRPSEGHGAHSLRMDNAQLTAPDALPLGDYRIVREIGRGGMGIVYEALQESLNRRVALKVLSPWATRNASHLRRFEREARAAAQLHHTNIVPVLGVGQDQDIHYLVMQLIPGVALDQVIATLSASPDVSLDCCSADTGKIASRMLAGAFGSRYDDATREEIAGKSEPRDETSSNSPFMLVPETSPPFQRPQLNQGYWRSVAAIGLQAADALAYAASQGVVHRDIKPSNLLLDHHNNVWIADFGLAKLADSAELTRTGELVGTMRYLPPERLRGQSDIRGDIYGLGATLYELVTLRPPFESGDKAILLRQLIDADPPKPRAMDHTIPRDLETIIVKAMAKHPADRYQSPSQMASDLWAFLHDRSISARKASVVEQMWRSCRRQPALTISTLFAALLLIVVAVGSMVAASRLKYENELAHDAERRALNAEQGRRMELFRAHVSAARTGAFTGRLGQRVLGIAAIRDAMSVIRPEALEPSQAFEMKDAAIRCLSRTDVRELSRVPAPGKYEGVDVDTSFQMYLRSASPNPGCDVISLVDPNDSHYYRTEDGAVPGFGSWRRFSPQGTWIAENVYSSTQGDSKRFLIWERATGRLALELATTDLGFIFDFHPDERHLLVAGYDAVLRMFDLKTGQLIRQSPPRFRTESLRFNRDGRWLALINATGVAEVLDPLTWESIDLVIDVPMARVVAFNVDDSLLVGTQYGRIYHRRVSQHHGGFLNGDHRSDVRQLRFSPDGLFLASSGDGVTQIRHLPGDQVVLEIPGYVVRFSPNGERMAVLVDDELVFYEFVPSEVFRHVRNHAVEFATFSPDGGLLALAGSRGVSLLSTEDWKQLVDFGLDNCGPVTFLSDGSGMTTMGLFSPPCCWPIRTGSKVEIGPPRSLLHEQMPDFSSARLDPQHQGRHVAIAETGEVVIADYRGNQVLKANAIDDRPQPFANLPHAVRVAISPDGRWIAAASSISTQVCVWNAGDARVVLDLPNFASLAFSDDGKWFATRSLTEVRVFNTDDWRESRRVTFAASRTEHFLPVAFQPQGSLLALAGSQRQVSLYDRDTLQLVAQLPHSDEGVFSHLAFSPDGSRLIAVQLSLGISVWDLRKLQRSLTDLQVGDENQFYIDSAINSSFAKPTAVSIDVGAMPAYQWYRCWERMSDTEVEVGNWPDAVHAMHNAIGLADTAPAAIKSQLYFRLGGYHQRNGEPLSARDDWLKALEWDDNHRGAALALARLYVLGPIELQNPRRVIPLVATVLLDDQQLPEARAYQALAQIRLGHVAEALNALVELAKSEDWRLVGQYGQAVAQHLLGDSAKADAALIAGEAIWITEAGRLSPVDLSELDRFRQEVIATVRGEVR